MVDYVKVADFKAESTNHKLRAVNPWLICVKVVNKFAVGLGSPFAQ